MARKIFGTFLILFGVAGIVLSVWGSQVIRQTISDLAGGMDSSIDLVIDSLDTTLDSLLLARDTMGDVEAALIRVEEAAVNAASALDGTDPILEQMRMVTTEDLPRSLETIERAVPDAVQAADAMDTTLKKLNSFEIDTSILGFPIQYDLGIDYDPTVPFSESVQAIGLSLEGIPDRLRSLEDSLLETQSNMGGISGDMSELAVEITAVNEQMAGFTPLINDFIRIITDASDNLRLVRGQIENQVATVNNIITVITIWLLLSQIIPLYLGYELIVGRLSPEDEPVYTVDNIDLIVQEQKASDADTE
jgi:hypothetical protein